MKISPHKITLTKCSSCEETTEAQDGIYGVLCDLCYDEREKEYLKDYTYDEEQEMFIREYMNIPILYEVYSFVSPEEEFFFVREHNSVIAQTQTLEGAIKEILSDVQKPYTGARIGIGWFLKQHPKHKAKKVFGVNLDEIKEQNPELFL